MRRPFLVGVVAALVVEATAGAVIIASGAVDVGATRQPRLLDRVLAYASTRSIAHHAGDASNRLARDAGAVKRGLEQYRDDCLACHGAPGARPAEFAAGLHPAPPDLASREVQSFSDGLLYQAISGGIGSTGMPAFARSHSREDIWSIVAFLRHLPSLTAEEKAALGRREAGESREAGAPPSPAGPAGEEERAASAAPARPGEHVVRIVISGFQFAPSTSTVHAGDVVEWKNDDFVAHTATADDRTFDTGRIDAGGVKRLAMKRKGRFPYSCRYHPSMKATLVVE